jgi:hypothetical protein
VPASAGLSTQLGPGPPMACGPGCGRGRRARVSRLESFGNLRKVVEVRLDGRRRATGTIGDLRDRQALGLPKMPGERHGASALSSPIGSRV